MLENMMASPSAHTPACKSRGGGAHCTCRTRLSVSPMHLLSKLSFPHHPHAQMCLARAYIASDMAQVTPAYHTNARMMCPCMPDSHTHTRTTPRQAHIQGSHTPPCIRASVACTQSVSDLVLSTPGYSAPAVNASFPRWVHAVLTMWLCGCVGCLCGCLAVRLVAGEHR